MGDVGSGLASEGARSSKHVDAEAVDRLLVATRILSGMRLPKGKVKKLFREVFGMAIRGIEQSSVVREWIEKGEARGEARGLAKARHVLLTLGAALIGPPAPGVVEAIGRIDDLDRIEAISDRLPSAASWEELLDGPGPAADAQR